MIKPEDFLEAPIPGMSLTTEPGSVPLGTTTTTCNNSRGS